jgi:hypothetical protein
MLKRLRPASRFQRPDDPLVRIRRAARVKTKASFAEALRRLRASIDRDKLVADVKAGNAHGALEHLDLGSLRERVREAYAPVVDAFNRAAAIGAKAIGQALASRVRKDTTAPYDPPQDAFAFDLFDQGVLDEVQEWQDALITALSDDARQVVFQAIIDGVKAGEDPSAIAADILNVVGLNDQQAQALMNYQSALANLNAAALDPKLRDASFDDMVASAIDSGSPLSDAQISDLVDAYADRLIAYRADTIAQTETSRAVNAGLQASYAQAIDRGVIPAEAVKQYWLVAPGDREEDACDECADMSADGIPLDAQFECSDGDFHAPPEHPRCQCTLKIRTNVDMLGPQ